MDLYEAGIGYLRAGLSILALTGKAPNGAFHPKGATPAWLPFAPGDEARWQKACNHAQTSGVGLIIPEHLCVVDVDGEEGAVSLQELIGPLSDRGGVARTGRGLHLWFQSPYVIPSMKLAPKLEIKGHGGYVAAPPSMHPDLGVRYEWLWPLVNEHGVVEADWLPEAIEGIYELRQEASPLAFEVHGGSIDSLAQHLKRQEPGGRNDTLYWAACRARDEGTPLAEALASLSAAALAAGLTKRETTSTIRSAYRGGGG